MHLNVILLYFQIEKQWDDVISGDGSEYAWHLSETHISLTFPHSFRFAAAAMWTLKSYTAVNNGFIVMQAFKCACASADRNENENFSKSKHWQHTHVRPVARRIYCVNKNKKITLTTWTHREWHYHHRRRRHCGIVVMTFLMLCVETVRGARAPLCLLSRHSLSAHVVMTQKVTYQSTIT